MVTTTTGLATSFIKFSRASNATLTDSTGNIAWAGHNILSNSESFDASVWIVAAGTASKTGNTEFAPNGQKTADTLSATSANATIWQTYLPDVDAFYTAGVWLKRKTGTGNIQITADGTVFTTVSVTSSWQLFTAQYTAAVGTKAVGVRIVTSGDEVYAWGAHLYRSDLGGMVLNPEQPSGFGSYYSTTPPNLLGNTENYNAATANKLNVTVISNEAVSPNGLQTADKVNATTTSGLHIVWPLLATITTVSGTPYVISAYVKAAEYVKFGLRENADTGAFATFNLVGSGSVISQGSGGTGSITFIGDNWYRVSMLFNAGATALVSYFVLDNGFTSGDPFAYNYAGDGVSGLYMWGAQLSNSASLDPYVSNPFAAPVSSAYYGPRLDFNSSTLICNGILCEEARTNIVLYSNDFSKADWTKINGGLGTLPVVTSGQSDPFGGTTGWRLQANSGGTGAGDYSVVRQTITTNTSPRTIWVRSNTGSNQNIYIGALGTSSVITVTPTWTRVSLTPASTSAFFDIGTYPGVATNSTQNIDILIWGAQCELAGASSVTYGTSYIPTTNAAVTRAVDTSFVASSAFPYNSQEGSFVVSFTTIDGAQITAFRRPFSFENMSSSAYQVGATYVYDTGVWRLTDVAAFPGKSGVALKTDDFAIVSNAGAARTGTGAYSGSQYDILRFGSGANGTNIINGHVRNIVYIPRRLTNAELQARTT